MNRRNIVSVGRVRNSRHLPKFESGLLFLFSITDVISEHIYFYENDFLFLSRKLNCILKCPIMAGGKVPNQLIRCSLDKFLVSHERPRLILFP